MKRRSTKAFGTNRRARRKAQADSGSGRGAVGSGSDRGQAHTLEAVTAALILLGSIVFALQSTAVTPLSASTTSQHIENQNAAMGEGVLAAADESGALEDAVLYYDDEEGCFYGSQACPSYAYADGGPSITFGETLNDTFRDQGIAFNLNILYLGNESDVTGVRSLEKRQVVNFGDPSDHAVTVRHTVTLNDGDLLRDEDGEKTGTELQNAESFYAPNVNEDGSVYNVVQVELVIWRM